MTKIDQRRFVHHMPGELSADVVLTPGGYRDRSLTQFVPGGCRIQKKAGRYRQIRRDSKRIVHQYPLRKEDEPGPDPGTGWVTFGAWTNTSDSPISQIVCTWAVPDPPRTIAGQTIFLFNYLQNAARDNIVQPVLQWGVSQAGGGDFWSISNWYVDPQGHASFSQIAPVYAGDTVTGIIGLVNQQNGLFSYRSSFVGYPDLDLSVSGVEELVWAGQALEAYRILDRQHYPDTQITSMTQIAVAAGGANPPVTWSLTDQITDLGESGSIATVANPGGQIDFSYGPNS